MCLLTLSVSVHSLKPPPCGAKTADLNCTNKPTSLQLGVFFAALYTLALGTGGTKPNISTIGADQFDHFHPRERAHKLSFFNWWMFSIFIGTLFANTVLVYLQDNVGWTLGYGIPTLGLAISVTIFVAGTPFYRHRVPSGSPFNKMGRVVLGAIMKWNVKLPTDPTELHELDSAHYATKAKFQIGYTPTLRFLNKAAVKTSSSKGILSTVTQVEETKQMLRMIPILFCTFIPSAMASQIGTLFVKQGTTLDRHIGPHFQIPPASLAAFTTISLLVSVVLYDRYLVPLVRRLTRNPRGFTLLQRMGIGIAIHILIMTLASLTERHRLIVARKNNVHLSTQIVPLTIFALLPQFVLMGIADAFLEVAKIEFFYDQAPEGMKSLGTSYAMTSLGIGNFISSFLLSTVARVTETNGHGGWIRNNLNASHFDYYYTFFAALNVVNFFAFLVVSRFYEYRAEPGMKNGEGSDDVMSRIGEVNN